MEYLHFLGIVIMRIYFRKILWISLWKAQYVVENMNVG